MFELNATLIIFLISFLVFIVLLNEALLKPVGAIRERRSAKIRANNEAAKSCRVQAEEVLAGYQHHLQQIRHDSQKVINEAAAEAQDKRNKQVGAVQEEARQKLEEAKGTITSERKELVNSLVVQETELVQMIASKLVGEQQLVSLSPEKVRQAIEEAV